MTALICAIITGYFARDLKLHVNNIKENKKKLYILGIASVICYIGNFLFYQFITKDIESLIMDIIFPIITSIIFYSITHGDREAYELTQKIKSIPKVKKSNNYFVIFIIFYLLFPIIASVIYFYKSGNTSIHIQNEYLETAIFIFIAYIIILFVACIISFRTFKRYYLIEINKKKDDGEDS